MNSEAFYRKVWRFINTHHGGGAGVGIAAILVVVIAHLINFVLLLMGHGDWVPLQFHWLGKLIFWR